MTLVTQLHCGDETYKATVADGLEARGVSVEHDAALHLLLDEPVGWASLPHPGVDLTRCVLASNNASPTYRLDLLERDPAALISLRCQEALLATLRLVRAGETLHPKLWTPLTPVERQMVRYTAQGHTNKEIAKLRGVGEGHVKNTLSAVYSKLNLRSRVQLAHYYYGSWHLLKDWTPPEHIRRQP